MPAQYANLSTRAPVHRRTVPSSEAVTSLAPSGLNAADHTPISCPANTMISCPEATSLGNPGPFYERRGIESINEFADWSDEELKAFINSPMPLPHGKAKH
jgi:hypothetical protein